MAISVWCLPRPEDSVPYTSIIESLAETQGAPVFPPHMTLGTLNQDTLPDLDPLAAAMSGLQLDPVEIDGTDLFTKSLFVRLALSGTLLAARQMLEALPTFRDGRDFDPHLSLCYGSPPAGAQTRTDIQELLDRSVRFDRLAAVRMSPPALTYKDVASWQTLTTVSFP